MVDDNKTEEVEDQVTVAKEDEIVAEEDNYDDDPMMAGLKEAEEEIAKAEAEPEGAEPKEAAKPEEALKEDEKEPEAKAETVMIPKPRLDQALQDLELSKGQVGYLQGIIDTQSNIINKTDAQASQGQEAAQGGVPKQETFEDLIAKAEADKIELAEKYEEGDITLVELQKHQNQLDGNIRTLNDNRMEAKFTNAQNQTDHAIAANIQANNKQTQFEENVAELQKEHPYVDAIDKMPQAERDQAWNTISKAAFNSLLLDGIDPNDGTAETQMLMIKEKLALTDSMGQKLTGVEIVNQEKEGGVSAIAKQREHKLQVASQQPPDTNNIGATEKKELTEADIVNMSDDALADLMETSPNMVNRAAGIRN